MSFETFINSQIYLVLVEVLHTATFLPGAFFRGMYSFFHGAYHVRFTFQYRYSGSPIVDTFDGQFCIGSREEVEGIAVRGCELYHATNSEDAGE